MTPQDFTYWLQGFVELNDGRMPSEKQWIAIQNHLQLVFEKKTDDVVIDDIPPITFPSPSPIWPDGRLDTLKRHYEPGYQSTCGLTPQDAVKIKAATDAVAKSYCTESNIIGDSTFIC